MKKRLVAAVVLVFLSTSVVRAQDDVAQKLIRAMEQIQELQKEIDKLKQENAKLEEALEQANGGGEKQARKKVTLNDLFAVGAVFTVKSEHIGGPDRGLTGTGTVTITSRDGDSFTASNTWVLDRDKTNGTSEIKGTIISANRAKWKRADGPIPSETIATLRSDGEYIDVLFKNAKGMVIKSVWKK